MSETTSERVQEKDIVVKRSSGGGSAFVWGTIIGALAGAAAALWYAPRSGKETVQTVRSTVSDTQAQAMERIQGESIEKSLAEGRALAQEHRARSAKEI